LPVSLFPHVFSIDLEEYFQANALERVAPRERWDELPWRVEASAQVLLDLLESHGATATFFTLGWIARRHGALLRRIVAAGHEIASHGFWHQRVVNLTPEQFREDVRDARAALEQEAGVPVRGYRAPSFSIVPGREWAFDVLLEEGYRYDSSLFPIRRRGYGYPGAPPEPHWITRPSGRLFELPIMTTVLGGIRVPAGGGGWFRQLPAWVTHRALREHERGGRSGMFYIHPWDLDDGQPRLPVPLPARIRHYRGLARTLPRLRALLGAFSFTSVARRYWAELREGVPSAAPA